MGAVVCKVNSYSEDYNKIKEHIEAHPGCTIRDINKNLDIDGKKIKSYGEYVKVMKGNSEVIEEDGRFRVNQRY